MSKLKKTWLVFKSFIEEECFLFSLSIIGFLLILVYIRTNKYPEIIPNGTEIMTLSYDIGIALLTGVFLYFTQVFLPTFKKRKNAQRELNMIINELTVLTQLLVVHSSTKEEISDNHVLFSNPRNYLYSDIENISKKIGEKINIQTVIPAKWNKKKITFQDECNRAVRFFDENYRELLLKYRDCLEEKTLDALERINRNIIFISTGKEISFQSTLGPSIETLLVDMQVIQSTANKINNFFSI